MRERKRCVWQANVAMNISSSSRYGGGGVAFIHSAGDQVRYLQTRLFPICTLPDRGTSFTCHNNKIDWKIVHNLQHKLPLNMKKKEKKICKCKFILYVWMAIVTKNKERNECTARQTTTGGEYNRMLSARFNVIVIASFALHGIILWRSIFSEKKKRERNRIITIANGLFIHSLVHSAHCTLCPTQSVYLSLSYSKWMS